MIFPTSPRLLAIFLVLNITRIKCENNPKEDSVPQQMMSDQHGEPDYLNQIVHVLSSIVRRMDDRLKRSEDSIKNLTDGMASLRLEMKNSSSVGYPEPLSKSSLLENSTEKTTHEVPEVKPASRDSFEQNESPLVLDVSTLPDGQGAIVFDENQMSQRKRRFWVLEKGGEMRFTMDDNYLKPESRITISGFKTTEQWSFSDYINEVYIDSSTANGTEFTVSGVVILITLTSNLASRLASSFALKFVHKRNDNVLIPGRVLYPSTFVMEEGRAVASFPQNNTKNYENNADHFMLISRPSGRDFHLTLTFMDFENYNDHCRRFFIEDDFKKTRFEGGKGYSNTYVRSNWIWGQRSAVVLFFSSDGSGTGKGYEIMIE